MPHKFKIRTVVYYHPKDRMLSTARGTYTITGLMPAMEGQQPEYRIKHFSEVVPTHSVRFHQPPLPSVICNSRNVIVWQRRRARLDQPPAINPETIDHTPPGTT